VTTSSQSAPGWIISAAAWLNPRRLRAQAIVLALCLWGVCTVDFATTGIFDHAGNIKFQDFLQFYISARLIKHDRASQLFDQQVAADQLKMIVGQPTRARLPAIYGPQVGLVFVPLSGLPFLAAARIWVTFSLIIYLGCIYLIWRSCNSLSPYSGIVALSAIAFPPLFHFFVRGQISVLLLACFTLAFLAFRKKRDWLAGIALGFLILKPPFLVAIPLVLLLSRAWKPLAALALSSAAQLAVVWIHFGAAVMRAYFDTLCHTSRWTGTSELALAPIQMHSLRSFWSLLIPWPQAVMLLYVLSSMVIIGVAAAVWRSSAPLALRFAALTLAALLANPHLFVYDLLVLAPTLLLLTDWTLSHALPSSAARLRLLLYLAFVLPLFGPLSQWTHLQLSVPVFVALLWMLCRDSNISITTPSHKLASMESGVV
jgi:hypothetical protein